MPERDEQINAVATRDNTSASTDASTVSRTPEGSSIPICPLPGTADDGVGDTAVGSLICTSAKLGTAGLAIPVNAPDIAWRRQV